MKTYTADTLSRQLDTTRQIAQALLDVALTYPNEHPIDIYYNPTPLAAKAVVTRAIELGDSRARDWLIGQDRRAK